MSVRYSRTRSSSSRSIRSFAKIVAKPSVPYGLGRGDPAGLSRSFVQSSTRSWRTLGCGASVIALSRWAYSRENASFFKRPFARVPEFHAPVDNAFRPLGEGSAVPDLDPHEAVGRRQDVHDRRLANGPGRRQVGQIGHIEP